MRASLGARLRRSTFAIPSVLAVATTVGLVVALVDDGAADVVGWFALALPLLAIVGAWRAAPPDRSLKSADERSATPLSAGRATPCRAARASPNPGSRP